jgi:hypothetical protein
MQTKIETQFTMYSNKLTLVSSVQEDETLSTEFKCNVPVTLAGDSIWDCDIEAVTITGIYIHEADYSGDGDISISINVAYTVDGDAEYEGSWRLYTDSGFAEAVSELLGTEVSYTEQGMQEDGLASMEL